MKARYIIAIILIALFLIVGIISFFKVKTFDFNIFNKDKQLIDKIVKYDIGDLSSANEVISYNRKYKNDSGFIISSINDYNCIWYPDGDINQNYKLCEPILEVDGSSKSLGTQSITPSLKLIFNNNINTTSIDLFYSNTFKTYEEIVYNSTVKDDGKGGTTTNEEKIIIERKIWDNFIPIKSIRDIDFSRPFALKASFLAEKNSISSFNFSMDLGVITTRSITLDPDVTACGDLVTKGATYTLTANPTTDGSCFTIKNSSITLNGDGYNITYGVAGSNSIGVLLSETIGEKADNFILKNVYIKSGSVDAGISRAIQLGSNIINVTVINSNITADASNGDTIRIQGENSSLIVYDSFLSKGSGSGADYNIVITQNNSYALFINTTLQTTGYDMSGTNGYSIKGWRVIFNVTNSNKQPIQNTVIGAMDSLNINWFSINYSVSNLTDSNGVVNYFLGEYKVNKSTAGHATYYLSNYTVNATKFGYITATNNTVNVATNMKIDLTIDNPFPTITINSPLNNTSTYNNSIILNWTVQDNENLSEIFVYASNDSTNIYDYLVYHEKDAINGTYSYNWTAPVIRADSSTVLLYHFDNLSSRGENRTLIVDSSSKSLNATNNGAIWNDTGMFAGAFQFNGRNGNGTISIVDPATANYPLDMNEYTISLWFMRKGTGLRGGFAGCSGSTGIEPLIAKGGGGGDGSGIDAAFNLGSNTTNIWYCSESMAGVDQVVGGSHPIINNKWYHVVYTVNATAITGYINGDRDAVLTIAAPPATNNLTIGIGTLYETAANTVDGAWNGTIDEVAIYNRSLTAQEAYNLYNLTNGMKYWIVNVSDSVNMNSSGLYQFNMTSQITDTIYPIFSSFTVTPTNNSQYSSSRIYEFNVTLANTNGTVGIEFNGVNYTITNKSAYVYNFTRTNLGVGSYTYYFWAWGNGTSHLYNTSSIQQYSVAINNTWVFTPLLNGANANLNIVYPQQINASFSGINQTGVTISINGTTIIIGNNYTWGAGGWLVNYTGTNNQNYSSISYFLNLTINRTSSIINLTLNSSASNITIVSPTIIILNGTLITGDSTAILELYNNGSLINKAAKEVSNSTTFSGVGIYNITVNYPQTQNYSQSSKNLFVNVTGDVTPPTCTLISRTPTDIMDNSTGILSVIVNCTDPSGINVTAFGDHYPFFITRTVDAFVLAAGIPNYWSNRYPNNSLGVVGTLTPPFKIWRALGRNEGYWYDNIDSLKDCTGLSPCYQPLNDTFSYAIEDGEYGHFSITNTSTSALINYTHPAVDISAFRQSVYLSYESMVKESKNNYTIKSNQWVLMKRFDAEAYRNTSNYIMNSFRDFGVVGSPGRVLTIYYCNSSYNPAGSTPVASSSVCTSIGTLTSTEINNVIFTDRNSSYSKGSYAITNGLFGGIKATAEFYIEYESRQSAASSYYQIRYTNGSTNTDVKFNDTKVAWTSTNQGTTWTQATWTPDVFTTTTRNTNDQFQFGIYVCNKIGNCYKNFTLVQDDIVLTNHPISYPSFISYNSSSFLNDIDLNETHSGTMNIEIGVAKDPDSTGNVTHNLSLFNIDGTFNYTINTSFTSPLDANIWINFNTSLVPNGIYKMNIWARSGDNMLDTKNRTTDQNFTINNDYLYPIFSNYNDNNGTLNGTGLATFNVTLLNTNGTVFLQINNTNYTAFNTTDNNFNVSVSLINKTYAYQWLSWGNGTSHFFNISTTRYYTVNGIGDTIYPNITLNAPTNNSNFTYTNMTFNCSSYDNSNLNNVSLFFGSINGGIITKTLYFREDGSVVNTTDDTMLHGTNTATNYGTSVFMKIDTADPTAADHGLIKFPNIFGNGDDQIPLGATILEANITLYITNGAAAGNSLLFYRLTSDWNETQANWTSNFSGTVWESAGAYPLDVDMSSVINVGNPTVNLYYNYSILSIVANWSAGQPNYGMLLNDTGADGIELNTSDSIEVIKRPLLRVVYQVGSSGGTTWHLNQTQTISGLSNQTIFQVNVSDNQTYNWNCFACDTSNNCNFSTSNFTFSVNTSYGKVPDTTPPYFITIPAPTEITYGQGFSVNFIANDSVEFDNYAINWTTLFNINQSGTLKNITQLAAGLYLINVTINDTKNNKNSTIYYVNVSKAVPQCVIGLNPSCTSTNCVYPTQTSVNFTENNLGDSDISYILYRNNLNVSNPETITLGVGFYSYLANATIGQNYTSNASCSTVNVNITINTTSTIALFLNHTQNNITIENGTSIWINATFNIAGLNIQLSNQGSLFNIGTSPIANLTTFPIAGLFNITASFNGNQNYSMQSQTLYVNVTQAVDTIPPYFVVIPPDKNITYLDNFNVTFIAADNFAIDSFFINWTSDYFKINQSGYLQNTTTLGVGKYIINVSVNDTSGNINSTIYTLNIDRKTSTCSLSSNSPKVYPDPINVSGSCTNLEDTPKLYRDNVLVNELGLNKVLGVGSYNYVLNVSQTQNYTYATDSTTVVITQATGIVNTYVDGQRANIDLFLTYNGSAIFLKGELVGFNYPIYLYLNGSLINKGNSPIQNLTLFENESIYNVTTIFLGNSNISAASETWFINATKTTITPPTPPTTLPECRFRKYLYYNPTVVGVHTTKHKFLYSNVDSFITYEAGEAGEIGEIICV